MEDYNRNERYQTDDRVSRNERNFEMNWDRNPAHYNNRENRNVYSSDRENEYWKARNNWRNTYPEGNYANRASDRSYNDRDWNNRYNDYRNEYEHRNRRYSDRYNDYENMNDYHTGYYLNYPGANSYRDRNYQWHDNDRGWWDKTKDEVASWFGDEDAERRRRRDEMSNGPHRGKGPKNYTRSEERIREDVSDKLSEDSFLDASAIEVSVQDGEVTLSGSVESRYSKHRAEDLAEDVTGVKNVQNNLRVIRNEENTIYKNEVNNGDRPITTNTKYVTTKNQDHSIHG